MPPNELPVEWVTSTIIRQLFNNSQIEEKAKAGEISKFIKRNSHLKKTPAGEPYCTHSQIVYYYNSEGSPLAVVHQYLRPDGTIGASGKPDPKCMFFKDRTVAVKSVV